MRCRPGCRRLAGAGTAFNTADPDKAESRADGVRDGTLGPARRRTGGGNGVSMLARVAAVCGTTAVVLSFAIPPASADSSSWSIAGYAPASAQVGATIDITGSGLETVSHVLFPSTGSTPVDVAPVDASSSDIHVVVPQGARAGVISVGDGSTTTQGQAAFTVLPPTASLQASAGSVTWPA